jgi:SAM-dependent methyltransferase
MPPKPLSAEYFDGWYADQAAMPAVAEIMNRHVGFPPGTRAGVVPAEAIPELTEELRLRPGSTLLDLACGRGAYGLLVAKQAGTLLIGVDFSAQALTEAREQAARMGVSNASFRAGELTATGLPDASVEAVLCTDAIQFPDEPAVAYEEIRRVLKPGGRVALTCWEPFDRADERLSPRLRRANLAAGLRQAGFTDVEVRDRPSWLAREHALWEEAAALDPRDDPALRSLHEEAVRSLQWTALLRRVLAVATTPLSHAVNVCIKEASAQPVKNTDTSGHRAGPPRRVCMRLCLSVAFVAHAVAWRLPLRRRRRASGWACRARATWTAGPCHWTR